MVAKNQNIEQNNNNGQLSFSVAAGQNLGQNGAQNFGQNSIQNLHQNLGQNLGQNINLLSPVRTVNSRTTNSSCSSGSHLQVGLKGKKINQGCDINLFILFKTLLYCRHYGEK